jgi:hypothetical protein
MPLIFRKIDKKSRWYTKPWASNADPEADTLSDLQTQDNKLSVFVIDEDKGNLQQVIAALAANRDHVAELDYALIDELYLHDMHLKFEETMADTPCPSVNERHRDLIELTGRSLCIIAGAIRGNVIRYSKKMVKAAIAQALEADEMDRTRVKESLMGEIG